MTEKQNEITSLMMSTVYKSPLTFDDKYAIMDIFLWAINEWWEESKDLKKQANSYKHSPVKTGNTDINDYDTIVLQYKTIKDLSEKGKTSKEIAKIMKMKREKVNRFLSI